MTGTHTSYLTIAVTGTHTSYLTVAVTGTHTRYLTVAVTGTQPGAGTGTSPLLTKLIMGLVFTHGPCIYSWPLYLFMGLVFTHGPCIYSHVRKGLLKVIWVFSVHVMPFECINITTTNTKQQQKEEERKNKRHLLYWLTGGWYQHYFLLLELHTNNLNSLVEALI